MKKFIEKLKLKLIKLVEYIHLKFFGHEMSDTMRKFLQNLSWSFFGGIIAGGILFVVNIFAGRILGPEEYGRYGLVVAIASVFVIPMTMGMDTTAVHYISKNNKNENAKRYIVSILMVAPFFLIGGISFVYLLQGWVINWFNIETALFSVVIVFAILLSLKNIGDAFLKGLQLFRYQSIIRVMEAAVIAALFLGAIFYTTKFNFVVYSRITMAGYGIFIILVFFKIKNYFQIRRDRLYIKKILFYGAYVVLVSISSALLNNFDKILINKYIGVKQLGIYNAYSAMSMLVIGQVVAIFANVFFSMISGTKEKRAVLIKINKIVRIIFLPVFLAMTGVIVSGVALFGKEYPLDIILAGEFSLLVMMAAYFTAVWCIVASQGRWGIRFTAIHGLVAGLIFVILSFFFRSILSINLVVAFLLFGYLYAVVVGNIKGIRKI